GKNEKFQQNVIGFIILYGKQIQHALACEAPINLDFLEEVERTTMLFYEMSLCFTPDGWIDPSEITPYYENCLKLLSKVNYLLTHPKTAAKLIVPLNRQEKQLAMKPIDKEIRTALSKIVSPSDENMTKFFHRVQQKLM